TWVLGFLGFALLLGLGAPGNVFVPGSWVFLGLPCSWVWVPQVPVLYLGLGFLGFALLLGLGAPGTGFVPGSWVPLKHHHQTYLRVPHPRLVRRVVWAPDGVAGVGSYAPTSKLLFSSFAFVAAAFRSGRLCCVLLKTCHPDRRPASSAGRSGGIPPPPFLFSASFVLSAISV